jgi:hypothetical protein
VGKLRFMKPEPKKPWTGKELINASNIWTCKIMNNLHGLIYTV